MNALTMLITWLLAVLGLGPTTDCSPLFNGAPNAQAQCEQPQPQAFQQGPTVQALPSVNDEYLRISNGL